MSDSSAYQPPITQKVSSIRNFHGDSFEDSYEWLRQKESPEVLNYLRAENDFCEKQTAQQDSLRKTIFEEIKGRVQETDLSVPTRHGNWWYFSRTVEGQQYPLMCRVAAESAGDTMVQFTPPRIEPDQKLAGEQIILDCNAWAEPLPFFSLGSFSPSLDGKLLTFGIDDSGDERFTQYFKNLETGEVSEEKIENIFAGAFLTADGESLIYSVVDDSWRPYEVRRHKIGAGHEDTVLFHESDQSMWLEVSLSADRTHVVLTSYSSEFSEVRIIPVTDFSAAPQLIIPKGERVQYSVEPLSIDGVTHLLILHDYEALNSEIVLAPLPEQSSLAEYRNTWLPVLAHQDSVRIESLGLTRNHLVITARQDTTVKVLLSPLEQLTHLKNSDSPVHFVEPAGFTEEIYTTEVSHNSVDSPVVRISYTSWVTPERIYDYFPESEQLELRRETPVLGGYSPQDYTAYRLWAPARDGKLIPLSVIHRADLNQNLQNPVLQYGYGSYEASMDPSFSVARLSLLDRGVVFVVAHVRGGGELGRGWYQAGKKLHKKNTFFDFVDSTDFLATLDWIDEKRIAIHGGSAGGLLVGAVLNLAPEKYCAAIADVPFVDALTTILDPDLPLSALEWEEWGNPLQDRETYNYMKSYTPYENIQNTVYPPIVAVTSLNDTRVYYVEPAKWVAKLRETISPLSPTPLLKIEMDGGHGGGSGRYTRWREVAWEYAFFLTHLIDSRNER
ncbi:S9 family peptidase [uncultured Rothia sp.]|uniref:S9 family peptidase n=1 Tax=uncultured Rothia sp. TaxID=316088 RepID=UPI0032177D4E